MQIKEQLPHLKAIVQYSDSLQKKLPNLYSVTFQSYHVNEMTINHL